MPEIMTGMRVPRSSKTSSIATRHAFITSVSNDVSGSRMSAPASIRARTWTLYVATISSNVTSRRPGSSTWIPIESCFLVGPMLPATNRGLPGSLRVNSSATRRASSTAAPFSSSTYSCSPNSSSDSAVPLKVSVSMMSAPASR